MSCKRQPHTCRENCIDAFASRDHHRLTSRQRDFGHAQPIDHAAQDMTSSYSSATAKGSPLLSVSTGVSSSSSRPSTPANADSYTFSTSLRRGEQDANPFHQAQSHQHQHHSHSHSHQHAFSHNAKPATPSSRFALLTCEQTLGELNTSLEHGLQSSVVSAIRTLSGPNEFAVAPKESTLSKFLKQFYESPLNLLLFGSAGVSALVGNFDDAISISLAITIVVTGSLL